jgi:Flp pilus assembly protein TadG
MSTTLRTLRIRPRAAARRGQALVEFGLVIGLFMLVIGGLVQFGLILWSQNAISEIARDTARYAVTLSDSPCDAGTTRAKIATAADQLARETSLMSYDAGSWATAPAISALGPTGVGVNWQSLDSAAPEDCPPSDNLTVWTVTVRVNHVIPIFLPGLQIIAPPCGGDGFCITSETELRMEPKTP